MAALGVPVRVVAAGGAPVVQVTTAMGQPGVVTATNNGRPITLVAALGKPMILRNESDNTNYVP
jgi:hypothetical protein